MRKRKKLEKVESIEKEGSAAFDFWLFFPEGIIAILFLLAFPIQAVILFMHNRVGSGIFLMACAAACIYSSLKLMENRKSYLAFCMLYVYVAISLFVGMS